MTPEQMRALVAKRDSIFISDEEWDRAADPPPVLPKPVLPAPASVEKSQSERLATS